LGLAGRRRASVGLRLFLLASLCASWVNAQGTPASDAGRETRGSEGTSVPDVVAPQMTEYSPPEYPPEAHAQGLEAVVRLQITVNADGTVSDPQVIESKGHGFDEAAKKAAQGLKFSPALVKGVPRAVRIGFEYVFELAQVEAPPEGEEKAGEALPQVGEIGGVLLLASTESPLPGVAVVLIDALGMKYETVTDAEGKWLFENMTAGAYRLKIAPEGFVPVDSKEQVIGGEATEITFRILPEATETEVIIRGERPPREVTRRTLQRREIERIPGTSGDALRSIQSLPGVARPPGLAGLLIVRGSAPEETGTFIDGAQIPLIYHFGGLSSVVPTELLDQLDFYPGNFSVRYGRFRGGIVDAALRKPNTECYGDYGAATEREGCYHGMVQVDLIDARVLAQGPVLGSKDWSFAVGGRRSWIDSWLKPVLEEAGSNVTSAPVYYDYQAIVERNKGPNDKLSFRFFGSDDRIELLLNSPAAQDPGFGGNLRFATAFTRFQAVYQKALSSKTNIDTMFSVGTDKIDFSLGGNLRFEIQQVPIDIRSEIGHKIHHTAKLNVGLDFQTGSYDVFVRAPPPPRPGEVASGPFATAIPLEATATGTLFRPAWYTDLEWQPHKRLRLVPGVRLDYARDSGHADVNPRVNARYKLILPEEEFWFGKPLGTTLKAGVGKYSQPPQFQETNEIFGTPGVGSNQSMHYSLGIEQGLTQQIEVSVEGYYKDFYNSVSRNPDENGVFVYDNQGSGRVIGMETLLKYNPDERFFGWVTYTLSQSLRRDCEGCELRNFEFDQTHNLIMLGSYRLGRGWELGARFRVVSGPLVTPVANPDTLPSIYSGDAGSYIPLQGKPYSERLPLFHQLDMRVDKLWQLRTWRFATYVDIQNVYNNAAKEALLYNYNFSQQAYQTGLPILPSLGVRGEF
jgi:TonB family protein